MPYILIIDDVDEFRHSIAELLEFEGFEVLESDNPEDGFAQMGKCRPDLILIDLNFPNSDGTDFIHKVRGSRSFASVPIIVVSGFNDAAHIKEAVAKGANDYLIKPFEVTKILNSIQNLIFQLPPVS